MSTFHPKLTYVSRQYKKDNHKTYVNLSNALQQDQGEDETIMENHLSRPTGTIAPPEVNAMSFKKKDNKGKGAQKAPWKGKFKNTNNFKKKGQWKPKKVPSRGEYGKQDQVCYRCGMKGHWSRICRTPKHIVDLYQELHGKKKAKHEANFVESKRLEKGECSKNADKEPAVPKPLPEEKEAAPSGKNFGAMDIDDNDEDDFGEEYEDMHGDTA